MRPQISRRLVDPRHGFVVGVEQLERKEAPTGLFVCDAYILDSVLLDNLSWEGG